MTWAYSVPQKLGFPVQEMVFVAFSYNSSLFEILGFSNHSFSCMRKILNGLKVDLVQRFATVCFEDDSVAGTLLLLCWAIILEELLLLRISSLSIVTSCE